MDTQYSATESLKYPLECIMISKHVSHGCKKNVFQISEKNGGDGEEEVWEFKENSSTSFSGLSRAHDSLGLWQNQAPLRFACTHI